MEAEADGALQQYSNVNFKLAVRPRKVVEGYTSPRDPIKVG